MSIFTLKEIATWESQSQSLPALPVHHYGLPVSQSFQPSHKLNSLVSVWHGDITALEVDVIVNSIHGDGDYEDIEYDYAGGHTTVADCIYKAAGRELLAEFMELQGKLCGWSALVTKGYRLPAKHVVHVEGPSAYGATELASCYADAIGLMVQRKLRSIAFPCISTGCKGFSNSAAAHIALNTIRQWLDHSSNSAQVDRIIFCTYEDMDYNIYCNLLPSYFPEATTRSQEATINTPQNTVEALDLAVKHTHKKEPENSAALEPLTEALREQTRRAAEAEAAAREEVRRSEGLGDTISNLRRSGEVKSQRIAEDKRKILTLENRVRRLEGELYTSQRALGESHQHADRMEREKQDLELRLSNSDTVFQEVLQRLIGQIPQSQPFWVVSRQEIQLTPEELGAGGWATVRVATFRGQRVAAKCLHNQIISAHNVRLFTREMNIAAQARHPNLLQFIGATMDDEPIILTELLPTSLRQLMETTTLSRQQIVSIAGDVARALNYLHLSSPDAIVHRDISSANVLLDARGEGAWKAKVSDYGSANFVRYTTTVGPGNPLYSAPEAGDPKKHSPKMDAYSFGMLLIEMCSGEMFDDYEELIRTHVRSWPAMLDLVRRCMQQSPQRRPNMSDILTQLETMP